LALNINNFKALPQKVSRKNLKIAILALNINNFKALPQKVSQVWGIKGSEKITTGHTPKDLKIENILHT
jgi:hypothetical protein